MTIADILTAHDVTAAELSGDLRAAATVLRKRGRTRRTFQDRPGGPVCIDGAMRIAVLGYVDPYPHHPLRYRYDACRAVMVCVLGLADDVELWLWNDFLCTSDERACEVLEQAAARVEAEAGLADSRQVMAA